MEPSIDTILTPVPTPQAPPAPAQTALDPIFAIRWIIALLSGEYLQGVGQLVFVSSDGSKTRTRYCCLGVAQCLLHPEKRDKNDPDGRLRGADPARIGLSLQDQDVLIHMNDVTKADFKTIARFISTLPLSGAKLLEHGERLAEDVRNRRIANGLLVEPD